MRILISLTASLLICTHAICAEEDPNYLYALSFQNGMTITRYARPEFAENLRATRPEGVSFNWTYSSEGEGAESAAKQEIDTINQAVTEILKSQSEAVLALTSIRGSKTGIWAFYTSDGARLAATLEASLKGKTRTPIRFRTGRDPDWKAFHNFLARMSPDK